MANVGRHKALAWPDGVDDDDRSFPSSMWRSDLGLVAAQQAELLRVVQMDFDKSERHLLVERARLRRS
jgi:hypothetical protein